MTNHNSSGLSVTDLPRYSQFNRELSGRWWIAGMFAIGSLFPIGIILETLGFGPMIFYTLLLTVSVLILIALVVISEWRLSSSTTAYKQALESASKDLLVFAYWNCATELCQKESKYIKETLNQKYPGWSSGSV